MINLTVVVHLTGNRDLVVKLELDPRMVAHLGSLLPHTSRTPSGSVELVTACEVGREYWTGFKVSVQDGI